MSSSPMRACIHCHKESTEDAIDLCSNCNVAFCCSSPCCDPADIEQNPHAHQKWCHQMSLYASLTESPFPFAFYSETSDPNFDRNRYGAFLQRHNLLSRGAWQREIISTTSLPPEYGELAVTCSDDELLALPLEREILRQTVDPGEQSMTSWAEYYHRRGIPITSPMCVLLQFPLTLYHVISNCLPEFHADVYSQVMEKRSISIHVLGVEKEADLLPLFNEVSVLLPNLDFTLNFFGPGLSKKVHGKVYKQGSMKIILRRKVYHKSTLIVTDTPDLIVGFNAGLAAYSSWQPTIESLATSDAPVYFTDYCRLSVDLSRHCLQSSGLGTLSEVQDNPFHSPIREFHPEHLMPCFSNAVIFRLIKS